MFELKPISEDAIPEALSKAERYRLLNEPAEAASICEDILRIDPDNQQALKVLLLAITDQFHHDLASNQAKDLIPRINDEYERAYYSGIISERRAKALYARGGPASGFITHSAIREAMEWFEKAEALKPPGNDDAVLRWNTCARFLMRHPDIEHRPDERSETLMLE